MIQRKIFPVLLHSEFSHVVFSLNLAVKITITAFAENIYSGRAKWNELNNIIVNNKHGDVVLGRYLRDSLVTMLSAYKELPSMWLDATRQDVRDTWTRLYSAGDERDQLLKDIVFNQSTLFGFHFTFHKTSKGNDYIRVYPTAELPVTPTEDDYMVVGIDDSFTFDPITLYDQGMVKGELNYPKSLDEFLNTTGVTVAYHQVNLENLFPNTKTTHESDDT